MNKFFAKVLLVAVCVSQASFVVADESTIGGKIQAVASQVKNKAKTAATVAKCAALVAKKVAADKVSAVVSHIKANPGQSAAVVTAVAAVAAVLVAAYKNCCPVAKKQASQPVVIHLV